MFDKRKIAGLLLSTIVFCVTSSVVTAQEAGLFSEDGSIDNGFPAMGGEGLSSEAVESSAEIKSGGKETTSPLYMYLIAHRIAHKTPDFRDLAMNSDEYKNTPDRERVYIIDNKIQEYKSAYDLITVQDPIKYEAKVNLSKYSEKLKGFFIENFDDNLFLPFSFGGKKYALVPDGAADHQWIKVEDENLANKLKKASARAKLKLSKMTAVLTLEPVYAEVTKPATINGKEYYLMSVKITEMDLYNSEYERPLWSSKEIDNNYDAVKLQEILKSR